jgi:lipoic acid synthetase/lipoate-protein ligase A
MFSYITSSSEVVTTFTHYCQMVADTLCQLGLDAATTGRNDVVIGDRKVSGNAFYHLHGRSIVHGTMLYDADLQTMSQAITPSTAKLTAKGVSSVRSHVTTIHEHLPQLSIEEFKQFCRTHLCDSEQLMTPEDIAEITRISEEYFTEQWLWGRYGNQEAPERRRIDGVGEFAVAVALDPPTDPGSPAKIRKVSLQGDFFLLSDLDEGLLNYLIGVDFTYDAILQALRQTRPADVIANLTPEAFAALLAKQ